MKLKTVIKNPSCLDLKWDEGEYQLKKLTCLRTYEEFKHIYYSEQTYINSLVEIISENCEFPKSAAGIIRKELRLNKTLATYNRLNSSMTDTQLKACYEANLGGGLNYINPRYMGKVVKDVEGWDAESFYASLMTAYHHPENFHEEFTEGVTLEFVKQAHEAYHYGCLVKAHVVLKDRHKSRYILRNHCNFKLHNAGGKRVLIEGCCWDIELFEILRMNKGNVEKIKISYCALYDMAALPTRLKRFIISKYMIKNGSPKSSIAYHQAKLGVNMIFGAFDMNSYKYNSKYVEVMGARRHNIIGSYTVALGRTILNKILDEIGWEDVIYADTDGFKIKSTANKEPIYRYNDKISRHYNHMTLGQFRLENKPERFKALAIKTYMTETEVMASGLKLEDRNIKPGQFHKFEMGYIWGSGFTLEDIYKINVACAINKGGRK